MSSDEESSDEKDSQSKTSELSTPVTTEPIKLKIDMRRRSERSGTLTMSKILLETATDLTVPKSSTKVPV